MLAENNFLIASESFLKWRKFLNINFEEISFTVKSWGFSLHVKEYNVCSTFATEVNLHVFKTAWKLEVIAE